MLDLNREIGSSVMTVSFGLGRQRGYLPLGKIRDTVTRLLRAKNQDQTVVQKIAISGRDSEGIRDEIELVHERMTASVTTTTDTRTLDWPEIARGLREAWDLRQEELQRVVEHPR